MPGVEREDVHRFVDEEWGPRALVRMKARGWSTRIVLRYCLLQLPALALVIFMVILIRRWIDFPGWVGWGFVALWVLKDGILFPFVWRAYDWNGSEVSNPMIGLSGTAKERLAPSGFVEVRGELWKAQLMEGVGSVEPGESVKVREIRGLTLIVQRDIVKAGE
jgi:membrane protein implicated in regulation of membrane protease activity